MLCCWSTFCIHLVGRGVEIDEGLAHVLIYLAPCIFILRFPLLERRGCLQYVAMMRPPSNSGMLSVPEAVYTLVTLLVGRSPAAPKSPPTATLGSRSARARSTHVPLRRRRMRLLAGLSAFPSLARVRFP